MSSLRNLASLRQSLELASRILFTGLYLTAGFGAATAMEPGFRLATFSADVTVPMGHGMMGGGWLSKSVADPLEAHGLVLSGGEKPVVFVALDWCEIRNQAFERWQTVLAEAAGTEAERVMVCAVHQHDAPVADLEAERILRERGLQGTVCDLSFHEIAVQRVAKALRESLSSARSVTHLGLGAAQVERIASNRRYLLVATDRHFAEHDSNLTDWCWVAPGSEARLLEAVRRVLSGSVSEADAAP